MDPEEVGIGIILNHPAGPAPDCPKINDYRFIGFQYEVFKIPVCKFKCHDFYFII
jgi:hypothetical protein